MIIVKAKCTKTVHQLNEKNEIIGDPYFIEGEMYDFKKNYFAFRLDENDPLFSYIHMNEEETVPHSLSDDFFDKHFKILNTIMIGEQSKTEEIDDKDTISMDEIKHRFGVSIEGTYTQESILSFDGGRSLKLKHGTPFLESVKMVYLVDKEGNFTYTIPDPDMDNLDRIIDDKIVDILCDENKIINYI